VTDTTEKTPGDAESVALQTTLAEDPDPGARRLQPPFDVAQGGPEALEGPSDLEDERLRFADDPAPAFPSGEWHSDPPSLGLPPPPARPGEGLELQLAPEAVAAPSPTSGEAGPFQEAIAHPDQRRTSPGIRIAQLKEELVAWVKTLLSAAVYAVLIVTFGFQVARVEGQSMAPTLEDQDRLIVNKLVYRIGEPRRGDIVMLYYPLNPDKSFVKRVIAEEGDTVRIVDGLVYVNDIPLKDDYVSSEYRSHDDWGPQVIPEGYYFVMGDHRNNSSDSRHWGMVPKRYIIGKVQLRWWPVPTARVF
jgi:signal peptidase I